MSPDSECPAAHNNYGSFLSFYLDFRSPFLYYHYCLAIISNIPNFSKSTAILRLYIWVAKDFCTFDKNHLHVSKNKNVYLCTLHKYLFTHPNHFRGSNHSHSCIKALFHKYLPFNGLLSGAYWFPALYRNIRWLLCKKISHIISCILNIPQSTP